MPFPSENVRTVEFDHQKTYSVQRTASVMIDDGSILMDGGVESNLGHQEKDTQGINGIHQKVSIFVFLNPVCWSWMDASRGLTLVF